MNFLNEIASHYPAAVSFASGRPAEQFFRLDDWLHCVPAYVRHEAQQRQCGVAEAFNTLAQYGRTNGIINGLIARQIALDEGIECPSGQILVTGGCQEALDLLLTGLCQHEDDVVLVRSPCYIGLTGVADMNRIELAPFSCADTAVAATLRQTVAAVEARGKRPRLLYLVPDFDNPTGAVLTRGVREEIIAFCAAKHIVIVEDNPYGMFRYEGERVPTMYALDLHGCVIYLGTYSKTICPALRVGFAAVPARMFGDADAGKVLIDRLSQAKSFVSVNTSQLTQAVVGGLLLSQDGSLSRLVAGPREFYRRNRDLMLTHLAAAFADLSGQISWNRPEGGFFLTLTLPFPFRRREAEICASDYGVLVMPLSFFALGTEEDYRVRLAFSNATPELIADGVVRLARFVRDALQRQTSSPT
ncbi:aminotransferase-like domain-containing protein [Duganella rhizosphaerae]|uniref:aminotransferase-like domain-containing protein n=1 Tax=Duganella rhizosphaerae TaxID=2885763 RepID=UPI00403F0D1F